MLKCHLNAHNIIFFVIFRAIIVYINFSIIPLLNMFSDVKIVVLCMNYNAV